MNAMIPAKEEREEKSTNVGRFLAKRGILLVKEFRDMMPVQGDYAGKVGIATVILSSAKSTYADVQYGIKLEHLDEEGETRGSAFLDYDEIDEVIGACDFLDGVSKQMLTERRDYTEVTYSTKDNLKFGFYQLNGQQHGFINVGDYGQSFFLSASDLKCFRESIHAAKRHLLSRGAEAHGSGNDEFV